MLLVAFLVTVVYTDWRWQRIPNVVTYPTIVIGLILAGLSGLGGLGSGGLIDHVAAVVLAYLLAYPFYLMKGVKAGDVKLLMSVGALRGTGLLLVGAFYGAIIGGLIALAVIGIKLLARPAPGQPRNTLSGVMRTWIPYGIGLGAGYLVALALELSRAS